MKKKLLCLLLSSLMLLAMLPAGVLAAPTRLTPQTIVGTTWYGEYRSYYYDTFEQYRQATTLTFKTCDLNGNYTAENYVLNVSNTSHYCRTEVKGTIDFSTGEMTMDFVRFTENVGDWHWNATLDGDSTYYYTIDDNGITGAYTHLSGHEVTQYFARTSEWALDEITEANAAGLIPDTIAGKDLTRNISRGEFAAVCVSLYESLTGSEITPYSGYKFIDIAGNENEQNIRKAYAANIAVGTGEQTFAPNVTLNREQMATMLTRVIKKYKFTGWTYATDGDYYLDTSGVKKFVDDAFISDWAKPAVYYLYKMDIVKGVDNLVTFAPRAVTSEQIARNYATATREQAILLALRVFKISDMI